MPKLTKALLLIIVLSLIVVSPVLIPDNTIWFDDMRGSSTLTSEQARSLIDYIAQVTLYDNASAPFPADIPNNSRRQIVFVSVSDGATNARVFMGRGNGIRPAVMDALAQLAILSDRYQPIWLKVDFVVSAESLSISSYDEPVEFERSLFGLAFDEETRLAFLPEELVAATLINSDAEIIVRNVNRYLERQNRLEQLAESADEPRIYQFKTLSYFTDGTNTELLYRGHRVYDDVSAEQARSSALAGGVYLEAAVKDDGRFAYSYLPKSNAEQEDYNILRHGGTTYAMLEVYEATGDADLLNAIQRALAYLVAQTQPCVSFITEEEVLCLVEAGEVKLGGHGLAILAIAKYTSLTGDDQYLPIAQELAAWIAGSQYEDGNWIHLVNFLTNEESGFVSGYYPGEAMFGLMRLYELDRDDRWLQSAIEAADYIINIRDGDKAPQELDHDHWLLYGLNELYREHPDPIYLEQAAIIINEIMKSQRSSASYRDWVGSFYTPPRSTPTATRMEGLCAAYHLFRDFKADADLDAIMDALLLGAQFQLHNQFHPESVMYLIEPQRALGGFHGELTNYEIRIDYVQHSISNLLCLADLLENDT